MIFLQGWLMTVDFLSTLFEGYNELYADRNPHGRTTQLFFVILPVLHDSPFPAFIYSICSFTFSFNLSYYFDNSSTQTSILPFYLLSFSVFHIFLFSCILIFHLYLCYSVNVESSLLKRILQQEVVIFKGGLMVEQDAGLAHRYQSIYLFPLILVVSRQNRGNDRLGSLAGSSYQGQGPFLCSREIIVSPR